MVEAADRVARASSLFTFPLAVLRAWRAAHHLGAGKPRWIAGGGAEPRAVVGHLLAALELSSQLDAPPDTIVVPLGTGGTAAGIALGTAWLGWTRTWWVCVSLLVRRTDGERSGSREEPLHATRGRGLNVQREAIRVRVVDALGWGYGHPTPEGESARALAAEHGLRLDPTYGAKAFSFFLQRATHVQRAVFWHTFAWP
jgi:D-cysteine desulfhydrase